MTEEKVSHDELSALQDQVEAEPEKPESSEVAENQLESEQETQPQQTDEVPEEPSDNAERSKLGRRVSEIEKTFKDELSGLKSLLLEQRSQPQNIPEYNDVRQMEEDKFHLDPDDVVTVKDLDAYNDYRDRQKQMQRERETQVYNSAYSNSLYNHQADNMYEEIIQELNANHNIRRSQNGASDAELNYLHAKNAVLERKMSEISNVRKSPLGANQDGDVPLGGPTDTNNPRARTKRVKLDTYAEGLVKDLGLSDEKVQKVLNEG